MTESSSKKTFIIISVHVLIWVLVSLMPYMQFRELSHLEFSVQMLVSIPIVAMILVFYVNYFYLYKFYYHQKIKFYLYNLGLFVLAIGFITWIDAQLMIDRPSMVMNPFLLVRNTVLLTLSAGTAVAIKSMLIFRQLEREKQELEKLQLSNELENLKYQLNPHFLFNTLNSIYALVARDAVLARKAITQLSKMMRYMLYESSGEKVPLKKEISFMENYIALMKTRVGDHVDVKFEVSLRDNNFEVAPLMYINLLENAFKHGIGPKSEQSHIYVEIQQRHDRWVNFSVRNSSYPRTDPFRNGSGIGVGNLEKRLALIYSEAYFLNRKEKDGEYIVNLHIKLD